MRIPVLVTCVGSQVSPSIIGCIRNHPGHEIEVIGVDAREKRDAVGAHFVDRFHTVPMGDHPDYAPAMEEVVRKTGARVILPGSDEEALSLSREKGRFLNLGCTVACPDRESVETAVDKFRTMEWLRERSVPVAEFYGFGSWEDLREKAERLGFPAKPFVIKPRVSRGGRGFRLVRMETDPFASFMAGDSTVIDFESLTVLFERAKDQMGSFLLMEYLPGKKYSTDILARDGRMAAVVIRNKILPVGSPTQLADIVFDPDLIRYAQSILEAFRFDYFVQFEIGRNREGEPRLIEINPRLDATLPICLGIGINFYHEMISHALGEKYSERVRVIERSPEKVRFMRYWEHRFVKV